MILDCDFGSNMGLQYSALLGKHGGRVPDGSRAVTGYKWAELGGQTFRPRFS